MVRLPTIEVCAIRRALPALAVAAAVLLPGLAAAAPCPGRPNALGTSRVMTIDPREFPRIGTMQYSRTLPLEDKEVVLTFDDGPMPPYTNRVLDVLAEHCVKANYFIIGRMARGYPDLVRRLLTEGHVLGTHSENHPLAFDRMPLSAVQREVESGIASVAAALGKREAVALFFRIPGLLRAPQVEAYLQKGGFVTWSADLSGDDWKHVSASEVVRRVMARLAEKGKGIVLLHDIQPATALALPELLRALKAGGYRIVQVAPAATGARSTVAASVPEPAAPTPAAAIASAQPRPPSPAPATAAAAAPPNPPGETVATEALARATDSVAVPTAAVPARSDPEHAADVVAFATPPVREPAETTPDTAPKKAPPPHNAPSHDALAAANPGPPPVMPGPNAPQVVQRPSPAATPADLPVHARTSGPLEDNATRPLTSGLKPTHGVATPGKVSVLRLEAPPHVVSVPVPRAGGVGVSALVRTSQRPDGRFQQER